jgi:uncharacterized protein YoxC
MDLRETVQGDMRGLEKLMAKIPGFKGYKQKEMRREADKILRMEVAAKMDEQRKRVADVQMQLITSGQIEWLDDLERAVMKMQGLIDRIRTASYGYAGLFDAVKVKEDQLDALYDFDNHMLDSVAEVAAAVDKVTSAVTSQEGVGVAIAALILEAEQAALTFAHRNDAILGQQP